MAVCLSYGDIELLGTCLDYPVPSEEPKVASASFFGIKGEAVIAGEKGARTLVFQIILHDAAEYDTLEAIQAAVEEIEAMVLFDLDTVTVTGAYPEDFKNCLLLAVHRESGGYRLGAGGDLTKYYTMLSLVFRQTLRED